MSANKRKAILGHPRALLDGVVATTTKVRYFINYPVEVPKAVATKAECYVLECTYKVTERIK